MKKKLRGETLRLIRNSIDDTYRRSRVSERIRETNVSVKEMRKSHREHIDIEGYKESIYNKYNIKQYTNKREFNKDHEDFLTDRQIDALWIDYKHRDKLIESGQYDKIRLQLYKENYVSRLEKSNYPREVISNIEKLDLKDWEKIVILPNTDKNKLKNSVLPDIGAYYYEVVGTFSPVADTVRTNIADIRNVFYQTGLKWESFNDNMKVLNALKYKVLDRDKINYVIDDEDEEVYIDSMVSLMSDKNIEDVLEGHHSKRKNSYYFLGVGSTYKGSRNQVIMSKFIDAVIKERDKRSDNRK